MQLELLIVRHGQSTADLEDRHEGRADFELTPLGALQAERVAAWIAEHVRPDRIISSTLKRARATAERIGERCGLTVQFDPELMEWNNGRLAGLLHSEAAARYPDPPGGRKPHDTYADTESYIAFRARAEAVLSKLLHEAESDGAGGRMCLVAHGGMINMLFRSFLKLPLTREQAISTGDTGIHLWKVDGDMRRIEFANSLEHLRGL